MSVRELAAELRRAGVATAADWAWVDQLRVNNVEHPFAAPQHWAAFVLIGAID